MEAGYEVVAIGSKKDEERLQETFEKSNAYWVVDQTPEWVTAAMLGAQCVIGVDSGMIHVAGLLGVPAVCIHSHLPPKFLFSHAPSVVSLTPNTGCTFCRWQTDRGYNEGCASACSALATVNPEVVMELLNSPKLITARAKLERAVARDTKRGARRQVEASQTKWDVIAYTHAADCGMGEAAEMNINAMRAGGLSVDHRIWSGELLPEPALADAQQLYYHHWHPQPQEELRDWRRIGFAGRSGAYHVAFWAYEIENGLPKHFASAARHMNEIWTPSTFCRGLFDPTKLPVHVVPHAVPFAGRLSELPVISGKAPFTVLSLFDAWSRFARKNPMALIRVFQAAFPNRMDVRLVLKGHHLSAEQEVQLQDACGWDSRISIINQFLNAETLAKLFASADVFLGLQRGEGFGLNLARSLGQGLPLITTGWSGNLDFCKPDNTFLVPYELCSVADETDAFHREGVWAEPDEKAAADLLAKVAAMIAKNDPELTAMRERGRALIEAEFSEQALCRCITERIEAARAQQAQRTHLTV